MSCETECAAQVVQHKSPTQVTGNYLERKPCIWSLLKSFCLQPHHDLIQWVYYKGDNARALNYASVDELMTSKHEGYFTLKFGTVLPISETFNQPVMNMGYMPCKRYLPFQGGH